MHVTLVKLEVVERIFKNKYGLLIYQQEYKRKKGLNIVTNFIVSEKLVVVEASSVMAAIYEQCKTEKLKLKSI